MSQYGQSSSAHIGSAVSKVELQLSCRNIPRSNCMINVECSSNGKSWQNICKTEVIKDSTHPKFTKPVQIDYYFEENQELKFTVVNTSSDKTIGTMNCSLSEIIATSGQTVTKLLTDAKTTNSFIKVVAQEVTGTNNKLHIHFIGEKLDKKDMFGKSDPFVRISRAQENNDFILVHQTEVVKKNLNPIWRPFEIPMQKLCNNDAQRVLLFQCYDWDKNGKEDYIGCFKASVQDVIDEMKENQEARFSLINDKKKSKSKSYKNSGCIVFKQCDIIKVPSFYEYIAGGCQINMIVGVDFTESNGKPNDSTSLHYTDVRKNKPNEYVQAMVSVGNILAPYDSDGMIQAYGFGAKMPNNQVSHCFALNGNQLKPEVAGVTGLLEAYKLALNNVTLFGPTNFSELITVAAESAKYDMQTQANQSYTILLILTDGVISDMQRTIKTIVEASDKAPLSIIIVGVGNDNFEKMNILDADDNPLSYNGKQMARDIVQFVPFRSFKNQPPSRLAAETLKEIPEQLVSWMMQKQIKPNPPTVYKAGLGDSGSFGSFSSSFTNPHTVMSILTQPSPHAVPMPQQVQVHQQQVHQQQQMQNQSGYLHKPAYGY